MGHYKDGLKDVGDFLSFNSTIGFGRDVIYAGEHCRQAPNAEIRRNILTSYSADYLTWGEKAIVKVFRLLAAFLDFMLPNLAPQEGQTLNWMPLVAFNLLSHIYKTQVFLHVTLVMLLLR